MQNKAKDEKLEHQRKYHNVKKIEMKVSNGNTIKLLNNYIDTSNEMINKNLTWTAKNGQDDIKR